MTPFQAIHQALDTLDAGRIQEITKGGKAEGALRDPGPFFQRIQREIRDDQTLERLLKVWAVLDVLSQTSLGSGDKTDHRLSISAQRCVVVLQERDPYSAVTVAQQALERGLTLAPQTILATVGKAWERAKTLGDLDRCVSLWEFALRKGALPLDHRQTVGQCDALLGTLCDPAPSHHRISSHYTPEVTLADISIRMVLGARLGRAVVEAGLVFNERSNQERISLAIRGLATVGVLTALHARYKANEIPLAILTAAADELRFPIRTLDAKNETYDSQQQAAVGSELLGAALSLAHQCFGTESLEDGTVRTIRRYALPGATVATLFRALERGKPRLEDAERESIAVITSSALELDQGHGMDEVRVPTLNCALGLVVRRLDELPEGGEAGASAILRAQCVTYLLYYALPKITEVSFLNSAIDLLGMAFDANPDGDAEYSAWHSAIESRIAAIEKSRAEKVAGSSGSRPYKVNSGWFSKALEEGKDRPRR